MVNFNADMDGAKEPGLSASIADEECFGSIAIIRKNKDTEIFKMREPMCIIGRGPQSHIVIKKSIVSLKHAVITTSSDKSSAHIQNVGGNGLYLNNIFVPKIDPSTNAATEPLPLKSGDVFHIFVSVSVSVSVPVPVPAPLSPSSTVTRLNTPKRKNPQDGSDQMASVSSPRRVTFVDEILSPHADSIKPKDIPITQQKAQTEHANEDLVSGLASEHSDGTGSEVSQQNGITSNGGSEHHAEGFSLGISQEQKDESILASVFSDIKEPSLSSNLAPNLSPLIVIERAINDHTSDIQIADDGPVDTNDPNSFQHRKVLPPNKSDHSQLSTTNPDSILGTDQSISVVSASIQLPKEDKLSSSSSVQDILLPVIIDLPQMNCNIDDGQVSANDNLPSEDRKKSIETEPDGISFQHTGQIVTGLLETLSPRRSERLTKQTDLKGPGFSSPMPQKQPEKLLAIGHDVENNNIFSSTEANGVFTLKTRRQLKRLFSDKENIPENRIGISNKNNINHQLELSKDISFMNSHQLLLEDRVQHVMSEPDLLSTGCSTPISDKTAPNKHSSARTPRSAISVRKSTRIAEKVTQIK